MITKASTKKGLKAYTPEEDAKMLELRRSGMGLRKIAVAIGRSYGSVDGRWRKIWAAGKDGSLPEMRPELEVAPAIVTNGTLRDREPKPCLYPLRTMVVAGRVRAMR